MIKIWCDGACVPKNPGGAATWGFVVYQDGIWIYEANGIWDYEATNNIAEYAAIIEALSYLADNGLTGEDVDILTDSKLIVNQLSGRWKLKAEGLKPLYWQVKDLEILFDSVVYLWISREQNEYADLLSKAVLA